MAERWQTPRVEFSLGPFVPIADRVHVAVAEPAGVNIGVVVVGSSGALLVDTGARPRRRARAIRAAAEGQPSRVTCR